MGKINHKDLQPGMLLANDVVDNNGRVLLKGGLELSDRHIKVFLAWGIKAVDIDGLSQEDLDAAELEKLDPAVVDAIESEAKERFQLVDMNNSFMKELYRLSIRILAQEKVSGS